MEIQERPEKLMTDYGRAKTKQKKPYNELLFNLKQYFGLFGKLLISSKQTCNISNNNTDQVNHSILILDVCLLIFFPAGPRAVFAAGFCQLHT